MEAQQDIAKAKYMFDNRIACTDFATHKVGEVIDLPEVMTTVVQGLSHNWEAYIYPKGTDTYPGTVCIGLDHLANSCNLAAVAPNITLDWSIAASYNGLDQVKVKRTNVFGTGKDDCLSWHLSMSKLNTKPAPTDTLECRFTLRIAVAHLSPLSILPPMPNFAKPANHPFVQSMLDELNSESDEAQVGSIRIMCSDSKSVFAVPSVLASLSTYFDTLFRNRKMNNIDRLEPVKMLAHSVETMRVAIATLYLGGPPESLKDLNPESKKQLVDLMETLLPIKPHSDLLTAIERDLVTEFPQSLDCPSVLEAFLFANLHKFRVHRNLALTTISGSLFKYLSLQNEMPSSLWAEIVANNEQRMRVIGPSYYISVAD